MKVNKKMLQQQLFVKSGRVVILRDLTNLTVKMKESVFCNGLVVELLEKDYGIIIFRVIFSEIRKIHRSIFLVLFLSLLTYIIPQKP